MIEMRDNGPEARKIHTEADRALYRSVYLPLLRGVVPKSLEAFDPVTQSLVTGQRESTTVPAQALYLLNSGFVRKQSLTFAQKVVNDPDRFDSEWIKRAYFLALGRAPTDREAARAEQFLTNYAGDTRRLEPIVVTVANSKPASAATDETADADVAVAVNPDDVDREPQNAPEESIAPRSVKEAAWMHFIQALYASAEFRFVR